MTGTCSHRLLVVTYHYVRDPARYTYPGIHPIAPDAFRAQIDKLRSRFHIATPDEVDAYARNGHPLPRDSAFITFDDGLVDHAETARDILNPLGVKAAFFVCTRPLTERHGLTVHKIHWLRATMRPDDFRAAFLDAMPEEWRSRTLSEDERVSASKVYVYDAPEHRDIKFLINFIMPEDAVDEAASRMLSACGVSEAEFCAMTYMDDTALKVLADSGHRIGAHTNNHRPVTRLGKDEVRDLTLNIETLAAITGRRPDWFAYPNGRGWALPGDPAAFCARHSFTLGFTLTRQWVDVAHLPWAVDRINTNEVDAMMAEADA